MHLSQARFLPTLIPLRQGSESVLQLEYPHPLLWRHMPHEPKSVLTLIFSTQGGGHFGADRDTFRRSQLLPQKLRKARKSSPTVAYRPELVVEYGRGPGGVPPATGCWRACNRSMTEPIPVLPQGTGQCPDGRLRADRCGRLAACLLRYHGQ